MFVVVGVCGDGMNGLQRYCKHNIPRMCEKRRVKGTWCDERRRVAD